MRSLEDVDEFFTPTMLAPGIALFGFVMLMFIYRLIGYTLAIIAAAAVAFRLRMVE